MAALKNTQRKSLSFKLGNLSVKGKFFLFVLIFALLGGGYYAYRSFAASPFYIQTAPNLLPSGGTSRTIENWGESGKTNTPVINMNPYNYDGGSGGGYAEMTGTGYKDFMKQYPGRWFKICVIAYAIGSTQIQQQNPDGVNIQIRGFNGVWQSVRIPVSRRYELACTGSLFPSTGDFNDGAPPKVRSIDTPLSVSAMTVQLIGEAPVGNTPPPGTPPTTPPPIPTPPANLYAYANQMKPSSSTTKLVITKGGAKVYKVPKGRAVHATFKNTQQGQGKVCSIFKLPKGGRILLHGNGGSQEIRVTSGNSGYQKKCTISTTGGGAKFTMGIHLKSGKESLVVSNLSFERK